MKQQRSKRFGNRLQPDFYCGSTRESICSFPLRLRYALRRCLKVGVSLLFLMGLSPGVTQAGTVTLLWDENCEPDVAGYRVYYRVGSSGSGIISSYNGVGIEEGYSPIDVPVDEDGNLDARFVEIVLHELDEHENYYFVVTAYNTEGLESEPSNEAAMIRDTDSDSNVASVSGGGGGGGCFISTLGRK